MKKHIITIITAILISCISYWIYFMGIQRGYILGAQRGYTVALDTVQVLLGKQLDSDTSITKLVIINPDTTVYYLSRKTALIK